MHPADVPTPPGYLNVNDVALVFGRSHRWAQRFIVSGAVKFQKIEYAPGYHRLYAEKASIYAYLRQVPREEPEEYDFAAALISARDDICLRARRILWERSGRQIDFEKLLGTKNGER